MRGQEFPMQAIVEKVRRVFAFKHPVPDHETERVSEEAAEFAAELLESYKSQLARRSLRAGHG
jgi:histone H3/H4